MQDGASRTAQVDTKERLKLLGLKEPLGERESVRRGKIQFSGVPTCHGELFFTSSIPANPRDSEEARRISGRAPRRRTRALERKNRLYSIMFR